MRNASTEGKERTLTLLAARVSAHGGSDHGIILHAVLVTGMVEGLQSTISTAQHAPDILRFPVPAMG